MPKLLFITVPTDEVWTKSGDRLRFPGTDKAIEQLTASGWEVEVMEPEWPKPLKRTEEEKFDAALVSCFRAIPRSRDSASMLARMSEVPVYTVGVLQKDEAFRTMAPTVKVLKSVDDMPAPGS